MYIPVAGNFPNNKVKLNQAENIEIAPRWTPAIEASTVNGMMIYNVHAIIVNISNTLDTALKSNQYRYDVRFWFAIELGAFYQSLKR